MMDTKGELEEGNSGLAKQRCRRHVRWTGNGRGRLEIIALKNWGENCSLSSARKAGSYKKKSRSQRRTGKGEAVLLNFSGNNFVGGCRLRVSEPVARWGHHLKREGESLREARRFIKEGCCSPGGGQNGPERCLECCVLMREIKRGRAHPW